MAVRRSNAVSLVSDICARGKDCNTKHLKIIEDKQRLITRINVCILVVNTLLGSTLWASLTRDIPVPWVKYTGLALSIVATFASGLILVLGLNRQADQSLEAAKTYALLVFKATKFRMSLVADDPISGAAEAELFQVYQQYNDTAAKYGDPVVTLQGGSTWAVLAPAAVSEEPIRNKLVIPGP